MELKPIPKGTIGWRVRRAEIHVMESMQRATTGQTGWHVWQKIKRLEPRWRGYELQTLLGNLEKRGYLEICGCDDGDFMYKVTPDARTN